MIYYLVIFFVCFIVFLFYKQKRTVISVVTVILSFFAGTRLNIDNDYFLYEYFFKYSLDLVRFRSLNIEFCIYLINRLSHLLFYSTENIVYFSFLSFALLGVSTKMIAVYRYSINIFLSIVLYSTYLFFMQEMTTIRAGVASGIFLLSLVHLVNRNYVAYAFYILFAFIFHNSSVLFILAGLLVFIDLKIKYFYLALILSFVVILTNQNLLQLFYLDAIFPRVATYLEIMQWSNEDKINVFNFKILISLLFLVIFAINFKKLKENRWFEILFRIHIFSLIVFFSLSTSAMVFSARSFDLLSVVQILLFPYITIIFNNKFKLLGWLLIIIFSIIQIVYLVEVSKIYKPYESWLF